MSQNHVKEKLMSFCLGELASDESRDVAEHLFACPDCRQVHDEIKLGISFASHLTPLQAPLDLWPEIAARLDSSTLEGPSPLLTWRPVLAVAAALVLVTIASLWYRSRTVDGPDLTANHPSPATRTEVSPPPVSIIPEDSPPPPRVDNVRPAGTGAERVGASLEVTSIAGAPVVAASVVGGKGQLAVGQWLETDGQSRAQITIADIGKLDVGPNSRISLVGTRPTEHRLNLVRGRVHALISAPPRLFIIETPAATAIDLGCEYTLEVDEAGGSLLRVTGGYVALEGKGREAIVPAGATCLTRPVLGPGTPYFEDATEDFRRALNNFDLSRERLRALQSILAEARRRDTLTLWNLLPQVSGADRERVYEQMVELFPPPDDVTRTGVLNLNREMLEVYRKRLEWVW